MPSGVRSPDRSFRRRATVLAGAAVVLTVIAGACTNAGTTPPPSTTTNGGWHLLQPTPFRSANPNASLSAGAAAAASASASASASAGANAPAAAAASGSTAGPSPTSSPKPKSTAPAAAVRTTVKSQKFSVLMPASWAVISVDGATNDAGLQRLLDQTGSRASTDQIQQSMQNLADLLPGGVKFIALKPATLDRTNLFVTTSLILRARAEGTSLASIEALTVKQATLAGVAASAIKHSQVKLANGTALSVQAPQQAARADGSVLQVHDTYYLILRGQYEYIVFFETLATPNAATLREFAAIAGSLKFFVAGTTTG